MKRLVLALTLAIALVAIPTTSAQASTLTLKEAKQAAIEQSFRFTGFNFPHAQRVRNCSRLNSERVRCSVKVIFETYWNLNSCTSRVEVTKAAEIKVATLRKKCRKIDVPFLSYQRAANAAIKAMDPNARKYMTGTSWSDDGKNRQQVEVSWEYNGQTCLQSARVRLVDRKVLVNVSEVNCVDIPDWPKPKS